MAPARGTRRGALPAAAAAFLAVALAGCGCDRPATAPGDQPAAVDGAGGSGATAAQQAAPLAAESLDPVIREMGPAGVLPEQIVIELARPVRLDGASGRSSSGEEGEEGEGSEGESGEEGDSGDESPVAANKSLLTITPAIPGTLSFQSSSTLVFRPKSPFAPATTYRVSLDAVESYAGVLKPPKPGAWSREFTTPKFDFVRASLAGADRAKKSAELDLTFSAPVELQKVKEHLSVTLGGVPVPELRVDQLSGQPHVARVTLRNLPLDPLKRSELSVSVSAGIPMRRNPDVTAGAGQGKLLLGGDKLVSIKKVQRLEGPSGHYLEVICDDDAVPEKRYYWDQASHDDYRISRRCQLDDADAAEAIHLTPATKVSVTPSAGGFRIFGDFQRGSYALRIDAGARSVDGGVLGSSYEGTFSFPARSPQVSFVSEGRYLPRKAWKSLPLKHLNVDQAELVVREVPQANLVFWMSDDGNEAASERTSNVILRQKLALKAAPDAQATTWVDVASLLPRSTRGLLELTVSSGPARDTARLLLTEMHLVAKRGGVTRERPWGEELQVFALGLDDLEPLSSVEVKLIRKSGQQLGSCMTEGTRGCKIAIPKADLDTSAPFALLASRGDDFTYLKFRDLELQISEGGVGGEPFSSGRAFRAALHQDRGVYRPGETAHVVAILRDRKDLAPKAGMPVELKLIDPRGRELKKLSLPVNEAGLVAVDLPFGSFAPTGRYSVQAAVGGKPAGELSFQVEEFVPERMKVTAATARQGYLGSEPVEVKIEARYLFGGIPSNHPVELGCELLASTFAPKEHGSFHYGIWRPSDRPAKPVSLGVAQGALDEEGKGSLTCPSPDANALGFPGAAKLVARAAVQEAGSGRTTVGEATAAVHPERFYLGLQSGAQLAERGKAFTVTGVAVDWTGALVPEAREVELELVRLENEYGWYYDEGEGSGSQQQYQRPVIEAKQKVQLVGGKFSATFTPAGDAGGFLVRARSGKAQTDLELSGNGRWYWYEPGEGRADLTPKPLKPTSLALETPERIKVGEAAKVEFKAPYRGRVLLTVETDRLLRSEWLAVEAGPVKWSFTLDAFSPNVYVSAFLVKDPHVDSAESFVPDRAFGVRGVRVEPAEFTQGVTLGVPGEVRSNQPLTVTLDLGAVEPGTYATVAAVDEGILSLTKFASPDPLPVLFASRALGVQTFETVGWTLLLPPGGPSRSTGGDGEGGAGRVQPVKPVALWSGVVPIPANGKATVTFQVPTYRGSLRVMAVTAGPKKLGRASANVVVRDPLTLQATLPRFLTAGDRIEIPIFLTNLSGKQQEATIGLSVENLPVPGLAASAADDAPAVELLGRTEKPLSLKDGEGGTVVFRARALKSIGAAKFKVVARGGGHESRDEADVPFVPASPKSRLVQRIELTGGSLDVKPYLSGWLPTTEQSTLWVTSNPYGEAFDHLGYLVRYPYGCIEQTTSSTWPLLAVGNLLGNVDPTLVATGKLEDMVSSGINRALSMQTPSGGFGYWPGASEPTEWASAYATHMLIDAQKLGYSVPPDRLQEALGYLGNVADRVNEKAGFQHHEPYLQYVLALGGKGRKARVQRLLDGLPKQPKGEQAEHAFLLQAALWLAGDHRYEKELKRPDLSQVLETRQNGWTFYSDRRRRGLMLNTFQDLFGNDAAGEPLAQLVAQALQGRQSGYYTTQELAWSVTGLGKRVAGNASSFGPVTATVNGKALAAVPPLPGAPKKSSDVTFALARASEAKSLTLNVGGNPSGKLYLMLGSQGIRERADWRVGGEGLKVRRRWLDAEGGELDLAGGGHSLGELVYTELTLANVSPERVANIALVDRFPAGWEVENPRLGRGSVSFLDPEQAWAVDYLNIRDDRLELFGSLERGETKKVVYAVRAVTAGSFLAPPVEAEAMYDPRIWAREAGRVVVIAGPWEKYVD